jgi:hypothetical protein
MGREFTKKILDEMYRRTKLHSDKNSSIMSDWSYHVGEQLGQMAVPMLLLIVVGILSWVHWLCARLEFSSQSRMVGCRNLYRRHHSQLRIRRPRLSIKGVCLLPSG